MRIAIVDDLPTESSKLTEILHRIAEENCITFDIVSFESGEAFLDVFEENSFNIVFMDIYMNGITGIETAKELRKTDKYCLHITDIRGDVYKTQQTLSEFMELLNTDRRFLQINKGILVNMEHIVSIEDNVCTLENGQALPIKVRDNIKIKEIWCQYGFERIRTDQKRRDNK